MKRSTVVALGTIAGVAGVLGLNPEAPDLTASTAGTVATETISTESSKSAATSPTSSTSPQVSATASATPSATASAETNTATGDNITGTSAQTQWGPVQLTATVADGKITAIKAVAYPANDGKSMQISNYSIPVLNKEAIAAQSASIQSVSGATFTSRAYMLSLQSILDQMG